MPIHTIKFDLSEEGDKYELLVYSNAHQALEVIEHFYRRLRSADKHAEYSILGIEDKDNIKIDEIVNSIREKFHQIIMESGINTDLI